MGFLVGYLLLMNRLLNRLLIANHFVKDIVLILGLILKILRLIVMKFD